MLRRCWPPPSLSRRGRSHRQREAFGSRRGVVADSAAPDVPRFLWHSGKAPARGFGLENLPYGVFRPRGSGAADSGARLCTRVGDVVVDLRLLAELGFLPAEARADCLNPLLAAGRSRWQELRHVLQQLLRDDTPASLKQHRQVLETAVHHIDMVQMEMPFRVGDFSDFYASPFHARVHQFPAWWQMPLAYHGRASSIVVSGTNIHRPFGQSLDARRAPIFGPSAAIDFELEVGLVIGQGNAHGNRIRVNDAESHVFGMVLLNDWSARDIQGWEMQPLGPFLGKSFATTISPWVVSLDALAPFRIEEKIQDPQPLPYLQHSSGTPTYDIDLEVHLQPAGVDSFDLICESNFRHLHWSIAQMVTHHTSNGCPLRPGDLFGTGTISGPAEVARGCMAEWSRIGKCLGPRPYLMDGDTVVLQAKCEREDLIVDFGECSGTLLPADENK